MGLNRLRRRRPEMKLRIEMIIKFIDYIKPSHCQAATTTTTTTTITTAAPERDTVSYTANFKVAFRTFA